MAGFNMTTQQLLANLVLAQLNGRKPNNIPVDTNVSELINIAERNHMNYLILGALIRSDNIPEKIIDCLRRKIQNNIMML